MAHRLITANSITPENLRALLIEIDALDQLPPNLLVIEKMVRLIADYFEIPLSTNLREAGKLPKVRRVLDCTRTERPERCMYVVIEADGYYHCTFRTMADEYSQIQQVASTAAWYFMIGLPYPRLWQSR